MVRLTFCACLGGVAITGLLAAAVPGHAAASARQSRPARIHALCGDDTPSGEKPLSKAAQTHPNNETSDRPASRSRRHSRASRPLPLDGAEPSLSVAVAPDRDSVCEGARLFQKLLDKKRVRLINEDRDRAQIESLCLNGLFQWPPPPAPAAQPERDNTGIEFYGPPAPENSAVGAPDMNRSAVPASRGRLPANSRDGDSAVSASSNPAGNIREPRVALATAPPLELFQMLNALATHSTAEKPLTIMSLLRPPYKTARYTMQSQTNPHALGIAVDIAAFGGHRISTAEPEEEVQALLALLKSLPPGRYRIGLPKAPEPSRLLDPGIGIPAELSDDPPATDHTTDRQSGRRIGALPSRGTKRQDGVHRATVPPDAQSDPPPVSDGDGPDAAAPVWPFFPPPQKGLNAQGRSVTLFANERYADEQYVNDSRVRMALFEARQRGVDVFALFPDGVNHIHIDVKQVP
jgi:hypothetical protein